MDKQKGKSKKPKILMFLIDSLLGLVLKNKFSQAGFEVEVFYSYHNVIEIVDREKPDILLCDVLLDKTREEIAKMNGFDAIKLLKKNNLTKHIPVIVLSDLCYEENIAEGLKAGAEDYLCLGRYTPQETLKFIVDHLIKTGKFSKEDFSL